MMQYSYFVVEGHHDVAAIGRVLKLLGLKSISKIDEIDHEWLRIVRRDFPYLGDLHKRMPVPTFFQSESRSVAIHPANGESEIVATINATLANIDISILSSMAIFCDADKKTPNDKLLELEKASNKYEDRLVNEIFASFIPGEIVNATTRLGFYCFPDNKEQGSLETLLIEGAETAYPDLLQLASSYIEHVDERYKQKWKPMDDSKALVGVIANVLKPGKSNQVSIQDNDWINKYNKDKGYLGGLYRFVSELVN